MDSMMEKQEMFMRTVASKTHTMEKNIALSWSLS